jgi:hypothetical protein
MPTAPKKPQDRKPKAEDIPAFDITETPGWDLLKPLEEVPVWDQTDLLAILQDIYSESEKENEARLKEINKGLEAEGRKPLKKLPENEKSQDFDIRLIGTLAKAIQPYAKDDAAFLKFVSGAGAMERSAELAMAWVGQMGESTSSDAS